MPQKKKIKVEEKKDIWNPRENPNVISIVKQPDGNYIGYMQKNGFFLEVRQVDPGTVLQLLITHG